MRLLLRQSLVASRRQKSSRKTLEPISKALRPRYRPIFCGTRSKTEGVPCGTPRAQRHHATKEWPYPVRVAAIFSSRGAAPSSEWRQPHLPRYALRKEENLSQRGEKGFSRWVLGFWRLRELLEIETLRSGKTRLRVNLHSINFHIILHAPARETDVVLDLLPGIESHTPLEKIGDLM